MSMGYMREKTDYENPLISFKELVQKAYVERIDLCDHGYYATPVSILTGSKEKGIHFYIMYLERQSQK